MKHEKELESYLPSAEEVENMDLMSFNEWVERASVEIPQRVVKRDPLYHLKKRISAILSESFNSDAEKEEAVHYEIRKYNKINR